MSRHRLRDHVLAEVVQRGVGHRALQRVAAEEVDAHRGQEGLARRRASSETSSGSRSGRGLLLELDDATLPVDLEDAEAGACSAVTGVTATVTSATWRRCVSSMRR